MQVDQALRALSQLKNAAPPTTAARLGDVIALMSQLHEENAKLKTQTGVLPRTAGDLLPHALEALRPSMQLVRGQAEALRIGRVGRITTEQADCLKLIFEHAASALMLLDTLDEIALMRQGLLRVDPLVFSGLDLLAEAWQKRVDEAELHDHRIEIHADDPLPTVKGDYRYILSIMIDLLDNAVRYTPYGGVIRVTAETLGDRVLFSVADNGIGLSLEDSEQVAQPFWRGVHQPLVRQHPGAGLRLYRARQILTLHTSELFFSGEPGMGSTFSFTLLVG
jgi:signal transduction histidine kinase